MGKRQQQEGVREKKEKAAEVMGELEEGERIKLHIMSLHDYICLLLQM